MSSRCESALEALSGKEIAYGTAHPADEIIGFHVGDPPVSAGPVPFLVLPDEILRERDKEDNQGLGPGEEIMRMEMLMKGYLRKHIEPLVNGSADHEGFLPEVGIQPPAFIRYKGFRELSQFPDVHLSPPKNQKLRSLED
jgi:hypothetical protein